MHKFSVGTPVILRGTGEHGTISALLPEIGGPFPLYRVIIDGRPAIPGRPEGPSHSQTVPENLISLGVNETELASADEQMRNAMRALRLDLDPDERLDLRIEKIAIRDFEESTDHQIIEASRYVEAIDIVEAE